MSVRRVRASSSGGRADPVAWVVRGGREGETVPYNLQEGAVTLGWGDWITEADAVADAVEYADGDALDLIFDQHFEKQHRESVRRRCRQEILRFRDKIHIDDLVVLPLKNYGFPDALAAIGTVTGCAVFDAGQPKGTRIRRPVAWTAREVAKSAIRADLRSSIQRSQLTVFQPRAVHAAWRISRIAISDRDPLL